ncbi:MAG: hypothetical protein JXO44_10375 [Clostridia bacterium]|nr:hypothetical protein [Clostridia bacterium]
MKKISIAATAIAVLVISGFAMRDNVEKVLVSSDHYVAPSEDVINQFGQLSISGFEWISEDVSWLDDSTVRFEGRRNAEEKQYYTFNTSTLEIKALGTAGAEKGLRLYEGEATELMMEKAQLSVLSNEEHTAIATSEAFFEGDDILVSGNEDKVGYFNRADQLLVNYDVSSHKKTSINLPFEKVASLKDVGMRFSYDGGFLTLEADGESISDKRFFILGADSGKYYGKDIKGIVPRFSPNSKLVAFIYNGEMDDNGYGGKVGVFVLKHKKIIYLDSLLPSEKICPVLSWAEDSNAIYGVTTGETADYMFNKFDVVTGTRSGLVFKGVDYDQVISEIVINQGIAYILFEKGTLCILNTENGRYSLQDGLLHFADGSRMKKLNSGDYLVFTDSELHYLTNDGYRLLCSYQASVKGVYLSPNENSVCLLLENHDTAYLQVVEVASES